MNRLSVRLLALLVAAFAMFAVACQPAQPAQPAAPPKEPAPAAPPKEPAAPAPPKPAPQVEKPVAKPPEPKPEVKPEVQPQRGGTLIVGTSRDMVTSNPFVNTVSVGRYIKEATWESLVVANLEGRMVPLLAESWEISDDATQFTFNLRRGVKFHDGQEMTADDVIWTIEHVMNPENGATGQARMDQVESITKIDDYTIQLTIAEPGVAFLTALADITGLPVVPAGSLQVGELDTGQNPPPGTGPFKFVEFVPNTRTVVERFDDYWGGAPYLDGVIFQLIPDHTVRFTGLRAGDLHVGDRIPPDWLPRIQAGEVTGISVKPATDAGMRRIKFNQTSPLMSNQALRQAVAYAIDRDAVLDEAYGGFATAMNCRVPVGSIWHTVCPETRQRDLARSRELLQQGGYNGEELSLMGRRGETRILEPLHRMLTEAGFNATIEVVEPAVQDDREARGLFDISVGGASLEPDPTISLREYYICEQGEQRRQNEMGYCNPDVDRILDEMAVTADEAARLDLVKQFAEITHEEVVNIYLGTEPRFFGWVDAVQDWEPAPWQSFVHADGGLARTWLQR